MKKTTQILTGVLFGALLLINSVPEAHAAWYPVQGITYTLSTSITSATTDTVTLASFNIPNTTTPYTMADFGYMGYATLDPNNTVRAEDIDFTGITDNSDGSVTLTGVDRGINFVYPFTPTSSLARTHLVGAQLILSNTAEFYWNEFALVNGNNVNTWPTASSSVASKGYADYVGSGGANIIPATLTAQGVSQLATGVQTASSTVTGSTGFNLVIPSAQATSTGGIGAALHAVVANNTGTIDTGFISSSTSTYTAGLSASSTVNGTGIYQVGMNVTYITSVGTTTYTVPANVTKLFIQAVASGGAAGTGNLTAGGGAGGYSEGYFTVVPGQVLGIGIGPAGVTSAGAGAGEAASSTLIYNTTTSTSLISCSGGSGGGGESVSGTEYVSVIGGLGGTCSGGTLNSTGAQGNNGFYLTTTAYTAPGGQTPFGSYGAGGSNSAMGNLGLVKISY